MANRAGRATGRALALFVLVGCSGAHGGGLPSPPPTPVRTDPGGRSSPAESQCDALADRLVTAYGHIVDAYRGASVADFAKSGFLGERTADAQAEAHAILPDAQRQGCDPYALLGAFIARGDEVEADGPGAVAAKGMLLAKASNAVFYGPGGTGDQPSFDLGGRREPTNDVSLEDVQAIDDADLEGCADIARAKALVTQWLLNELAEGGQQSLGGDAEREVTRADQGLKAAAMRSGCSPFEFSNDLIEAMDGIEALGFFANVQLGEVVKDAWLEVQQRLVRMDVELDVSADPAAATVGDTVRIHYAVTNAGSAPVGDIRLLDQDVHPVGPVIPLLEPGESKTVTQMIKVVRHDVPTLEIRVEVQAADAFGRETGQGFTGLSVPVSPG